MPLFGLTRSMIVANSPTDALKMANGRCRRVHAPFRVVFVSETNERKKLLLLFKKEEEEEETQTRTQEKSHSRGLI